jgi:hypothetical protein
VRIDARNKHLRFGFIPTTEGTIIRLSAFVAHFHHYLVSERE